MSLTKGNSPYYIRAVSKNGKIVYAICREYCAELHASPEEAVKALDKLKEEARKEQNNG